LERPEVAVDQLDELRGSAPSARSATRLFLKRMNVGMDVIQKRIAT
jgi:hypothetical protein